MNGVMKLNSLGSLKFGLAIPANFWNHSQDTQVQLVADIAASQFEHIYMADHVSFRDGSGTDGFVEVAALSAMHPHIGVMISVYLLPLRHPLPVARQLATMHKIAPGRMMLGVGIGGDDRHEVEVCGVDPRTRGALTNESLGIIRQLMGGGKVNRSGGFFELTDAQIKPVVGDGIPIIVGGRSDAALDRAAEYGDGWIGVWCSPQRYAQALTKVAQGASACGRENVKWLHGYQPWVGVADSAEEARALVAKAMEIFYKVPFEKFERYVPYGTPDEVAAQLNPYVDAGCRLMNLKVVAANDAEEVRGGAAIRQHMLNHFAQTSTS